MIHMLNGHMEPKTTDYYASPRRRGALSDTEKVVMLLLKTRSVTLTARMLGVPTQQLSEWLHRAKRIKWWERTKAEWKAETKRGRERRYQAKKAAHAANCESSRRS